MQAASLQVYPSGQVLPHAPQFCVSDSRSVQPLSQTVSPVAHAGTHWPLWQRPVPQEILQPPQFSGSTCESTQVPSQIAPEQTHWPLMHAPGEQLWPQAPQFAASLVRSTHDAPHIVFGATQVLQETPLSPWSQYRPLPHALSQAPQ